MIEPPFVCGWVQRRRGSAIAIHPSLSSMGVRLSQLAQDVPAGHAAPTEHGERARRSSRIHESVQPLAARRAFRPRRVVHGDGPVVTLDLEANAAVSFGVRLDVLEQYLAFVGRSGRENQPTTVNEMDALSFMEPSPFGGQYPAKLWGAWCSR